jgi:hypothetical protein
MNIPNSFLFIALGIIMVKAIEPRKRKKIPNRLLKIRKKKKGIYYDTKDRK